MFNMVNDLVMYSPLNIFKTVFYKYQFGLLEILLSIVYAVCSTLFVTLMLALGLTMVSIIVPFVSL